eukprot:Clim_evm78s201 gene=Clim_evmTU78s201
MAAEISANRIGAVLSYCGFSMSMIYSNKYVLSSFQFPASSFILVQALIASVMLWYLGYSGTIKVEGLKIEKMIKWSRVTVLFCAMLVTGSLSLGYVSIAVVTVFKNSTNFLVAFGDRHFYGQEMSSLVLASICTMVMGSILAGYTDLQFSFMGYFWMTANCFATAAYSLYLKTAKRTTHLEEWSMAYYNNVLTSVFLGVWVVLSGEINDVLELDYLFDYGFLVPLIFTGVVGTGLSFSVFWLVGATSPTTFSIIGSLNKIPLSLVGIIVFGDPINFSSGISIAFGLVSGVFYAMAKIWDQRRKDDENG